MQLKTRVPSLGLALSQAHKPSLGTGTKKDGGRSASLLFLNLLNPPGP